MKLLNITLTTFAILLALHTGIRMYGRTAHYRTYDHPLVNQKQDNLYRPQFKPKRYDLALQRTYQFLEAQSPLFLDIQLTSDMEMVLYSNEVLGEWDFTSKKKPSFKEFMEFLNTDERVKLDNVLNSLKASYLVLNIKSNWPGVNRKLFSLLDQNKLDQKVIVVSEYGNVVRNGRDERPYWLFANSMDELTKANLVSNLLLESVAPLKAHVWFLPLRYRNISIYTDRLANEITRRHKKLFVTGLQNPKQLEQFSEAKNTSFVFENFELFQSVIKK